MPGTKVYIGAEGVKIKLDCNKTVVGATGSQLIKYIKPDGTTGVWTATAESTKYLSYTSTSTGVLNMVGVWKLNTYNEDSASKLHGETYELTIYRVGE